jgi:hypothetical protein
MQVTFAGGNRVSPSTGRDVGLSCDPDGPFWPLKVAGVPLAQFGWLPRRELPPCAGEASPIVRFAARPAKARYKAGNCRSFCGCVLGSRSDMCRPRGCDDGAALATAARLRVRRAS